MNRTRRRILKKMASAEEADFTSVPTATICSSIQLLVNELIRRGEPLHDFDDKEKVLLQIRILDKPYFLAAKEDEA